MLKGMRELWEDCAYLIVKDCNDGTWIYDGTDNLDVAWAYAFSIGGYVRIND